MDHQPEPNEGATRVRDDSEAPAATTPVSPGAGLSRRELMAIFAAVFFGGALMMALLVMRTDAPREAAAADNRPPAAKRARSTPAPSSATSTWSTTGVDRWIGNGRRKFAIELFAENRVAVWQRQVTPVLVVRCLTQRPEVFVFTDSAAQIEPRTEDHTVQIAFDDGPSVSERWPDSADHDALFAPDGEALARQLIAAHSMRFGFTPHNAPAVVAHFNVAGLAQHLEAASSQCGWKR